MNQSLQSVHEMSQTAYVFRFDIVAGEFTQYSFFGNSNTNVKRCLTDNMYIERKR